MNRFSPFFRISKKDLILSLIAIAVLLISVPLITYIYYSKNLVSKEAILNKNNTGVILLDRDNKPFFTFYEATFKSFTPLKSLPKHVPQAVIASEDKDFYSHPGFSLPSIIRAFFVDMIHRERLYGGSTITQQLVKNALLNSNKNYLRKIQEVILAQEIESRYKKDEILEMYLNFIYFGENAFGIDNAALTYFGKNAQKLTIAEAAFLTAILPSPSAMSPFTGDMKEAKVRQRIVLDKMYNQKYISLSDYEKAKKEKLTFKPSEQQINAVAPHFALMVRDELIKEYGESRLAQSGIRVKTTLDRNLQMYTEASVAKQVEKLRPNNVSNAAAVVIDPKTGEVLALVGSANWYDSENGKINLATTPRSVGSSFKPIVYAAALENNQITPATILRDNPTTFKGGYTPQNYDRKFRGPVTVRRALSNSLNVPAVEVMQKVGLTNALNISERLGITTLSDQSDYGLSLVLGTGEVRLLELTNIYATFAAQGVKQKPTLIAAVYDKNGKRIYKPTPKPEQVLTPEASYLISSILSDSKARSEVFGNTLSISRQAAVKTGTAEDYTDALTVGYTPSLAVGVWVGNNDNTAMDSIAGSLGAAPIWKEIMEFKLKNTAVESFTQPSTIVKAPVCRGNAGGEVTEYFIRGTQPTIDCRWYTPNRLSPSESPNGLSNREERWRTRETMRQQIRDRINETIPDSEPIPSPSPAT